MLRATFWTSALALVYTHAGYPLLLWLIDRVRGAPAPARPPAESDLPHVSLIVAAHEEEDVIAARVANALALDYPRERLEVIVASDGSRDSTAERARVAGADLVLELERGGKIRSQDAAVAASRGELLAFSDANSLWQPDALRCLVARFADPAVGYVCGQVSFRSRGGTNQEGVYWRYENAVRLLESRLAGVTAGNGAIYAVRRTDYMHLDPRTSHDLSFPFNMVRRGRRALYEPLARAEEEMAPTLEGEFRRKRRMMRHAWPTVLGGGMLDPRGYPAAYGFEIASHRLLRYATPALHLAALTTSAALALRRGAPARARPPGAPAARAALALQLGLLGMAAAAPTLGSRPLRLARYYVLVTAALAAGLWDHLREGTPTWWERGEDTR